MDHCVIDKMFLNNEEKSQILAALEGLREADPSDSPELLRKLGDFFQTPGSSWVSIDFSDWSGEQEALFSLLKHAILQCHVIAFDYYGSDGKWSAAPRSLSSCGLKAITGICALGAGTGRRCVPSRYFVSNVLKSWTRLLQPAVSPAGKRMPPQPVTKRIKRPLPQD